MARNGSPNEDIVDLTVGEDRSRSRERGEQPVAAPSGAKWPTHFDPRDDELLFPRTRGFAKAKGTRSVPHLMAARLYQLSDLKKLSRWAPIKPNRRARQSLVGRMLDDLVRVLEQDHQEWVLHQEGKFFVEIMIKAIKPETLKAAVQKQLQRNKGLKSDVFRYVKWLRQFSAVLSSHPIRHPTERGALVEGLVRVENVLLDTGAVVSRGVTDALADTNATVAVQVHDQPRLVYPYGVDVKPLEMKRHVKFGMVTLDTTCGPLTLRGLQAWIDETSTAMDFIVSRPVMEVLGFSIDDLLYGARRQQAEWDVSPGSDGPVTSMSRVQRLLVEERYSPEPELADTDGMACATPEVEIPPPSDQEDERHRMKRDKVFGILRPRSQKLRRVVSLPATWNG
ncbi:hypothetical protein DYB32_006577 [Aphanomyces invadans]|uniref:Uncharacterized protein n=1 Tax=Aphanomyces invadans TaxID=157072 RepID=A0A3R7CY66_9STRA|nr:hypothetical protein DYB32_006577 [Aphanomyces invadans]